MYVIEAATAPRFQLPGLEFTGLASPSRGASDVCTWRLTVEPGLRLEDPHTLDRPEIFMVLSGAVRITPESPVLRAGDAVVVPAGGPIQLVNPGDEPAELYIAIRSDFGPTMADGSQPGAPPWAQ
jgi:mannose-6-phosphate isomerase-like protein (cupin superfamily)